LKKDFPARSGWQLPRLFIKNSSIDTKSTSRGG
jgi:hypothetical protein